MISFRRVLLSRHNRPSLRTRLIKNGREASELAKHEAVIPATYQSREDTIAAIVTGMQRAAVGIIRISGSEALDIARSVFRSRYDRREWTPKSHRVYYGDVVNDQGTVLDEVLCLVFKSPRSYTAEDVVEIHCHGGRVSVERILQTCVKAGARTARAGEFTLRAFLNGRIDLSQAESVAQLVESRTVGAADSALAGLKGGIGETISELRRESLDILGELEARLDFDEDMEELNVDQMKQRIDKMQQKIEDCLKTASKGRLLREGLQVAIVGRPNVGKSSLMNSWSGVDKSIVTEIPGTTRDVVEADLSIDGVPVTLLDTAGIREGSDVVEQMGISRASDTARSSDLVLMVIDAGAGWTDEDALVFHSLWSQDSQIKPPAILVANKSDTLSDAALAATGLEDVSAADLRVPSLPLVVSETFLSVILTSAVQRQGIEDLAKGILSAVYDDPSLGGGRAWAVNERQSEALFRSHEALERVMESIEGDMPIDVWTIDLREALLALGEISGEDVKEEILDNVFSRFCIGK